MKKYSPDIAGYPGPNMRTWDASGLVEKRNLLRVPRKAFPVPIDTMPANEINDPGSMLAANRDDAIRSRPSRRVLKRDPDLVA